MKYSYYPGCSLHSAHKGYDISCKAVFNRFGCELVELEDWNCCGATIYMSIKRTTSLAIAARNLALAEKQGMDIVTPCSSCYTILSKAHRYLSNNKELLDNVNDCLTEAGLKYNCTVRVRHPLDVLVNDGLFHVMLGSLSPLPDSVFNKPTRWLSISVDGEPMAPRLRITGSAYAMYAQNLDLLPTDLPDECNESNKGKLYYDESKNEPCYCNGTEM